MINICYILAVLLTAVTGIITGSLLLMILAVSLVLLTVISAILVRWKLNDLDVVLNCPSVTSKNQVFEVSITVSEINKNTINGDSTDHKKGNSTEKKRSDSFFLSGLKKHVPVGRVQAILVCTNRLTGEQTEQKIRLRGHSYRIQEKYCGCLDLSLRKIRVSDWTGVIRRKLKEDVSVRVLVMPDTFPLEASSRLSFSRLMDAEEYSPYKKGQDRSETFQIRDYVPGDPLQQIHWKLSARMNHLVLRDPSLPVDHSILLFYDKSRNGENPAVIDALCEAYTSVVQAFSEAGVPFQMAWNGETIHTFDLTLPDQLPEAIAELLKTEQPEAGLSGAELYSSMIGNPEAGQILYFTSRMPADLRTFAGNADIHVLMYGSTPGYSETEEGIPVFGFTPDDLEQPLQEFLELTTT